MSGCESLTIKKPECWRIDAFELWCWRRLLRVPWTARRSNQPILKEISPGCSLEGLMLKLKLQSFITKCKELTHWKRPSCWEKLRAGGEGDDRGWDGWKASPTLWTWVWVISGNWWWTGMDRESWYAAVHGVTKSQTWLSNWTALNWCLIIVSLSLCLSSSQWQGKAILKQQYKLSIPANWQGKGKKKKKQKALLGPKGSLCAK